MSARHVLITTRSGITVSIEDNLRDDLFALIVSQYDLKMEVSDLRLEDLRVLSGRLQGAVEKIEKTFS